MIPVDMSKIKCDITELRGNNKVWKERILLNLGLIDIENFIRKEELPIVTKTNTQDIVSVYEKLECFDYLFVMFIKTKISAGIYCFVEKHTKLEDLLKATNEKYVIFDKVLANTIIIQL